MDIQRQLLQLAADGNREFAQSLQPGVPNVLGIRVPQLRNLAREIARGDWKDYIEQADTYYMEERLLTGLVIGYIKGITIEERFSLIRRWVPQINSWAVCDSVCTTLKPGKGEHEAWWQFIVPYMQSNEEYSIRFGVVMALSHFVDAVHLDHLFRFFCAIHHDGYYVKMAIAWAVSVCYVKFPNETYAFLAQDNIDAFTHNKAIQKICESYRVNNEEKDKVRVLRR